jgi:putative transposase
MQTSEQKNTGAGVMGQEDFRALMREKMCAAVRLTLMAILNDELKAWVGAERYERSEGRKDHRIGKRFRDLGTSVGLIKDLPIPRTRGGFQTELFEKYQRRQQELDGMIGDMFVQGVSQARVGGIMETLNGVKPSPSTVSRVFHTLEEEYQQWRVRTLPAHYKYVFADGTFFSVDDDHVVDLGALRAACMGAATGAVWDHTGGHARGHRHDDRTERKPRRLGQLA